MAAQLCHVTLPNGVTELLGVSASEATGINGKITFTPVLNDVVGTGGGLGVPDQVETFVKDGQWVDKYGNPGAWFVRPDSTDATFVYSAKVDLGYRTGGGNAVRAFHIAVPAAATAVLDEIRAQPGPPHTWITKGETGPAPAITNGTIATGAPGSAVALTFTETSPGVYTADGSLPQGQPGAPGGSDAATAEFISSGPLTTAALEAAAPIVAKVGKGDLVKNVKDFGAKGDGATDDTAAIRAAAAAGTHLHFPFGEYVASSITEGQPLVSWANKTGVTVDAAQATITCPTAYTGDVLTPIFSLDNCKNVDIRVGLYKGTPVADPATQLGYRGTTFLRAFKGTDGVRVDAALQDCRYGVQSGDYATPANGYCKNFDIRLRTKSVGYPVALYLAEGAQIDVDADDVHRAVYLAGCVDVTGVARWRNMRIAPIAVIISDALTSGTDAAAQADPVGAATTSRGSKNIKLQSINTGSTIFGADTYCIGLSLSRVDPVEFRDIDLRYSVTSTDTQSTTIHGCIINSTANGIQTRYPFNWESTIKLTNITVGGVDDKSAVTTSTGVQGPFALRLADVTHAPTVTGLSLTDLTVRSGVAMPAAILSALGATAPVTLTRVTMPGALNVSVSASVPTVLTACDLGVVDALGPTGGSRIIAASGTRVTAFTNIATNAEMAGGTTRGGGAITKTIEASATLTGASVTIPFVIPGGSLVLGVQGRIVTAITGADGFQVGVTADITRFANRPSATAVGYTFGPEASTETTPRFYLSGTSIVITARTADFTGGVLRLLVHYVAFPAMTS